MSIWAAGWSKRVSLNNADNSRLASSKLARASGSKGDWRTARSNPARKSSRKKAVQRPNRVNWVLRRQFGLFLSLGLTQAQVNGLGQTPIEAPTALDAGTFQKIQIQQISQPVMQQAGWLNTSDLPVASADRPAGQPKRTLAASLR